MNVKPFVRTLISCAAIVGAIDLAAAAELSMAANSTGRI